MSKPEVVAPARRIIVDPQKLVGVDSIAVAVGIKPPPPEGTV
jgi:hypothetical protein